MSIYIRRRKTHMAPCIHPERATRQSHSCRSCVRSSSNGSTTTAYSWPTAAASVATAWSSSMARKTNVVAGSAIHDVGPLVPASMPQSITESSIPLGGGLDYWCGGVPNQGGTMTVSMNPAAMKGVTSGLFSAQPAMQILRTTQEELIAAKRWNGF